MKRLLYFGLLAWLITTCNNAPANKKQDLAESGVPNYFEAEFHTTQGSFTIAAHRSWSPLGVERLYELIAKGYYDSCAIFRVQPEYVVQFGINKDTAWAKSVENDPILDEAVLQSNSLGRIAFARDGAHTRSSQLFINVQDNPKLDTINYNGAEGFPPIAEIKEGLDIVRKFYSQYGFEPAEKQDSILKYGNAYLKESYPNLDYILEAKIVKQ